MKKKSMRIKGILLSLLLLAAELGSFSAPVLAADTDEEDRIEIEDGSPEATEDSIEEAEDGSSVNAKGVSGDETDTDEADKDEADEESLAVRVSSDDAEESVPFEEDAALDTAALPGAEPKELSGAKIEALGASDAEDDAPGVPVYKEASLTEDIESVGAEAEQAVKEGKMWIAGLEESYAYTGKAIKPLPRVYYGGERLVAGRDYTLSYSNNLKLSTDAKKAKLTVKGKGNLSGSKVVEFLIVDSAMASDVVPMSTVKVSAKAAKLPYDGTEQSPVWILKNSSGDMLRDESDPDPDYQISGESSASKPGTYTVYFAGANYYGGYTSATWQITGKIDLASVDDRELVVLINGGEAVPYTSAGAKPAVTVTYQDEELVEGIDYSLSYKNNKLVNSDKTCVQIKGKGIYKGSITRGFTIVPRDISDLHVVIADRVASTKAYDYKKTAISFYDENGVKQAMKLDRDYALSYTGEPQDGVAGAGDTIAVKIKGIGNYASEDSGTIHILEKGKDIAKAGVKVNAGKAYAWTGRAIEPAADEIAVTLNKQVFTDFKTAWYANNSKKGTAVMLLRAADESGYGGAKLVKYKIAANSVPGLWGMKDRVLHVPETPNTKDMRPVKNYVLDLPDNYIDVCDGAYGAIPDDGKDDTTAINKAIKAAAGKTVYIPSGVFDLTIDSNEDMPRAIYVDVQNVTIMMENDTILKVAKCNKEEYGVLFLHVPNITVVGGQISGERDIHTGKNGAGGHGVIIDHGNIKLEHMQIYSNWGDGIYINDNKGRGYGSNIVINDCDISNNRRSNISIVRGEDITISYCDIYGAHGSSPSAGINIEPDNVAKGKDVPEETGNNKVSHGIKLSHCRIESYQGKHYTYSGGYNYYYAFEVNGGYHSRAAYDITIENCEFRGDFSYGSTNKADYTLKDNVYVGTNFIEPNFK